MKNTLLFTTCLLELIFSSQFALAANSGLKAEWRPGGSKWSAARSRARSRKILDAAAERRERRLLQAEREEGFETRDGMKVKRFAFEYAYPVSMTATNLLDSAKRAMDREQVNTLVVAITSNSKDDFSYFLQKNQIDGIEVTPDNQRSADLAGLPYESNEDCAALLVIRG